MIVACAAVSCEASWFAPLSSIAARVRRLLPGDRRLASYDEVEAVVEQRKPSYESVEEEAWDLIQRHHINRCCWLSYVLVETWSVVVKCARCCLRCRHKLLESEWKQQPHQQQQQQQQGRLLATTSRARVAAIVQKLGDRYSRLLPPSEYVALHSRTTGAEKDTGDPRMLECFNA